MKLDAAVVESLKVQFHPKGYLRITPLVYRVSPLGLGYGKTRFASPSDTFKILYLGKDLTTSFAETVLRDRFVGKARRLITEAEVADQGITVVGATQKLTLVDMREMGAVRLGLPTDAIRGKSQRAGRAFSELLHTNFPEVDGILYQSRLTVRSCVAVYERAVHKLSAGPVVDLVAQRDLWMALAELNVELV